MYACDTCTSVEPSFPPPRQTRDIYKFCTLSTHGNMKIIGQASTCNFIIGLTGCAADKCISNLPYDWWILLDLLTRFRTTEDFKKRSKIILLIQIQEGKHLLYCRCNCCLLPLCPQLQFLLRHCRSRRSVFGEQNHSSLDAGGVDTDPHRKLYP